MAAGFKQATVNASDVPATQTNFPAYVDLSRLGITTLAEAQSVRVYADSGKTTEWAREIVSATEMHVKIPSLTSTTSIYVDYDGIRADYAVGDTYGRNAVWSDYTAVFHLNETSGSTAENSTGGTDGTYSGTPTATTGTLGGGQTFNSTDYLNTNIEYSPQTGGVQMWVDPAFNEGTANKWIAGFIDSGGANRINIQSFTDGNSYMGIIINNNVYRPAISTAYPTGQFKLDVLWDTTTTSLVVYYNNSSVGTASPTGTFNNNLSRTLYVGAVNNNGTASNYADGVYDEVRLPNFYPSANWITTEYNNQVDEAGFWGTWSDVGGGGYRFVPQIRPFVGL